MSQYLHIREFARAMRKSSTKAEEFFWSQVRNRRFYGLKFNRQHILVFHLDAMTTKFYIGDFYCAELKLIIELDGDIHDKVVENDAIRTTHLIENGYHVLRFPNEEVLHQWPYVEEKILEYIRYVKATVERGC